MKSLLIGTASAAIALAPQASASNQDDNFLGLLARAGIPARDGIPGVISYGHKVCDALNGGESPSSNRQHAGPIRLRRGPVAPAGSVPTHNGGVRPGVVAGLLSWTCQWCSLAWRLPHCPRRPGTAPSSSRVAASAGYGPHDAAGRGGQAQAKPPPGQKPPPPPKVVPPPSQGLQGGQGKGGTRSGIDGGGSNGGGVQPAPEPPEGHIALLP